VATAYEVRVTTHQRKLPELPAAREPDGRVVRHPSVAPLVIAVAAAEHVTVDLEGFYVSPERSSHRTIRRVRPALSEVMTS
jgi:hypothetical protein